MSCLGLPCHTPFVRPNRAYRTINRRIQFQGNISEGMTAKPMNPAAVIVSVKNCRISRVGSGPLFLSKESMKLIGAKHPKKPITQYIQ